MKNTPTICVGIPCYNAQDSIVRTITSALAEGDIVTEVLVVDDASTDDSVALIQKYFGKNPKVRVVKAPQNGGVGQARRLMVENTNAEFIAFLDSDDVNIQGRVPNQLAKILEVEKATGSTMVMCVGPRDLVKPDGTHELVHCMGEKGPPLTGLMVANHILFGTAGKGYTFGVTGTCTTMVCTQAIKDVGNFDGSLRRCEDLDFAIRIALSSGYITGVGTPVIQQFRTVGAHKNMKAVQSAYRTLIHKYKAYLKGIHAFGYAQHYHGFLIAKHFRAAKPMLMHLMLAALYRPDLWLGLLQREGMLDKVLKRLKRAKA